MTSGMYKIITAGNMYLANIFYYSTSYGTAMIYGYNNYCSFMYRASNTWADALNITVKCNETMSYKANGILGAKNFLAGTFTSGTNNGIVYTVNSDNSVNISGTVSSTGYSLLQSSNFILKPGTYTISKNPFVRGLSGSPKYSVISIYNVTAGSEIKALYSEDYTFTITSEITVWIRLTLYTANTTYNGKFYPMIRIAEDTDDTYQPYAMTNKELTENVTAIESYNSHGVTALATAHADGNKTFSTLLQELWPTISSYGSTQRMNLCIKYDNNYFNAVAQNDFLYSIISATYASYFAMMFRVGNNTGKAYSYNPANSTPYADISNEKPPVNADLILVFRH